MIVGVADARTGAPLAGAEVLLPDLHRLAATNWIGEARLTNVAPGEYRVRVRKLGYAPSEVRVAVRGDSVGPVFFLEPTAPQLDTLKVIAKRGPPPVPPGAPEAFGWRRQMGIGRFLTEDDLVVESDRAFAMVAASRLPGVRRVLDTEGREVLATQRGSCGGPTKLRGSGTSCGSDICPIRILLDGMDVNKDFSDLVRTWDLAAVEFYSASTTPVQYRDLRSGCGVLLLWSKR